MKPCPEGEVRDRKTKTCRKRLKPGRKSVSCPPNQIKDRKTKECRSRMKRGRKQILRGYAEVVNPTQELFKQCHAAGSRGKVELKTLLSQGANINAKEEDKTPLMVLAEQGNVEMLDLFLLNHADIKAITKQKETVLHMANPSALKKLLTYENAPIHQVSQEGYTALHKAIERNLVESVQLLLQHNAKIGEFNKDDPNEIQFAISYATLLNNTTVVRTILPYLNKEQLYDSYLEAAYWADPENEIIESDRVKYKHIADIIHKNYSVRFPEKKSRKNVVLP